jgi:hypothetical protein
MDIILKSRYIKNILTSRQSHLSAVHMNRVDKIIRQWRQERPDHNVGPIKNNWPLQTAITTPLM